VPPPAAAIGVASTPPANPATPAANANASGLAAWQASSAAQSATPRGEVTLAMQTESLGRVQVRASLHDNLVGATLAVDRPEVHSFLAAQMPALERSLAAKQIAMGSLNLQQGGAGGNGQAMPQFNPPPQARSNAPRPAASDPAPAPTPSAVAVPLASSVGGTLLNLRV